MGRYDLIADGSTTADLTAGESADVGAAINGMKSLCGLCIKYMIFDERMHQENNEIG